ncbi:MAG: hypothetical protein KKF42_08150 [Actinobacteria bacterium]|nr:hypothetical protein [Actinomycetota bacterium]
MSEPVIIALGVALVGGAGTALGAWLAGRATRRAAEATAGATVKASEDTAQDKLIDQLQEELIRYRERTDARLDALEAENRGYRSFIGVQRDWMAEHGTPLPPWPEGLPR